MREVRTKKTEVQYSQVRPSRSLGKRLVFMITKKITLTLALYFLLEMGSN